MNVRRASAAFGALLVACNRTDVPPRGADAAAPQAAATQPARLADSSRADLLRLSWPADPFSKQLPYEVPEQVRREIPTCEGSMRVTADTLGVWSTGSTLAELVARCPSVWTFYHFEEGEPYPAVAVRVAGAIVRAELTDTVATATVTRLVSWDGAAITPEGVGPGRTFAALEEAYGMASLGSEECGIYAWSPRALGIAWMLYFPAGWDCSRADSAGMPGAARPPGDTPIGSIIVVGATRAPN